MNQEEKQAGFSDAGQALCGNGVCTSIARRIIGDQDTDLGTTGLSKVSHGRVILETVDSFSGKRTQGNTNTRVPGAISAACHSPWE